MTPEQAFQKQIDVYRRMTGPQRLQVSFELYELAQEMVRSSVRRQHPDWDDEQVTAEVVRRFRLAARIP
jgi:hypothetical protein